MHSRHLLNGALSFAISVTVVLTLGDGGTEGIVGRPASNAADAVWDRTDLALTAGLAAFLSGVCTSYFGDNWSRLGRVTGTTD